ncbi:hypothetical protein H2199_007662 [Coniosporium tulheliwenetii]|uniref:Uncharacterized protein n=1 Tax=Coniosporium tulheliwenetii TaxID=3383036 RepID=A0ACC2YPS1_9PEZI|nr:hypothetical protein H2199_007662 [Cladosporium sp. JES 115]
MAPKLASEDRKFREAHLVLASSSKARTAPLEPLLAQPEEVPEPEPESEPLNQARKHAITSGFEKIHLPAATIETVKAFGVPLLNRRSEFAYGVLANNIIPGLLLHGPPGTGKTQLVKALAKYCETRVLRISAGRINTKWFGESERAVATAFTLARKLSPCILFIDEADSMLRKRRGGEVESEAHRSTLSQFLSEWDGFGTDGDKPIFVVLATNRPSDLDDAILRRAPKRIAIGIPTFKDRVAILKIHLQGEQLDSDVSIEGIARKTDKFTGSDLKNLCIAAAYACIFEDDAHKTESEVPDKVEDGKRWEEEIDVEIINLDGENGEVTGVERHAENHVDIDDEEHGEDIPLLSLPSNTAPATVPELPLPPPTTDNAATSVPDPPRRLLKARHFEKAIKDITPTSTSKTGMSIDHIFENGLLDDTSSQPSKSNTATKRMIVIPRSRVPF